MWLIYIAPQTRTRRHRGALHTIAKVKSCRKFVRVRNQLISLHVRNCYRRQQGRGLFQGNRGWSCGTQFYVGGQAVPRWRSSKRERLLDLNLGSGNEQLAEGGGTQPATRADNWNRLAQHGDVWRRLAVQPFESQSSYVMRFCIGSQCCRSRSNLDRYTYQTISSV